MQETKELKDIEIKAIDDLNKLVPCELINEDDIRFEDGKLKIGTEWLKETTGFHGILNVALYELLEAGIIKNYFFFVPNWLWGLADKIDLNKIGWFIAVLEVQK